MYDEEKNEQEKTQSQDSESVESKLEPVVLEGQSQEKTEQVNYKDLFLRVSADLQNYQRRIEKQKLEWTMVAQESIILKLIPVIEDLNRALSTSVVTDQPAVIQWLDGLEVIQKNLKKTLHELGIEEIVATGDFNPELHEAIAQIDSPEHKTGQIVNVVCNGYKFKDKVIKYAQVVVAK